MLVELSRNCLSLLKINQLSNLSTNEGTNVNLERILERKFSCIKCIRIWLDFTSIVRQNSLSLRDYHRELVPLLQKQNMANDTINIREYVPSDKEAVLKLIRLNTPQYFAEEEEVDLSNYLDNYREYYYVLLSGIEIIGCGGINMVDNGILSTDIIQYFDYCVCNQIR